MKPRCAAIFAALFVSIAGLSAPTKADDVTLRSTDGAIELSGTLLGYDGDFYRIDTWYGVLSLDGSLVSCTGEACPSPGDQLSRFTLAGAGMMAETLLPALIEGFAQQAGYRVTREPTAQEETVFRIADAAGQAEVAEITLRRSSTTDGIVDLITDQADIALASRELSGSERAIAIDAGLGDLRSPRQYRVLARDGLVPVVNAANPVQRISIADLAAVYSGVLDTWSALGGEDIPITLHLTDPQSGIAAVFTERVVRSAGKDLATGLMVHPDLDALTGALARDPGGIGVTSLSHIGDARALSLAGDCGLDVDAGSLTVKAGDYPLTLPLYLFLPGRRLPKVARELLVYLRSSDAQAVVQDVGFIDQTFVEIPLAEQGVRLANAIRAAGPEVSLEDLQRMMPVFTDRQRLSLTFRFLDSSTELDAPSLANIATLADALKAGVFDGRRLSFAGFSDGTGSASANLGLSRRRAETVRAAVLAWAGGADTDRVEIEADGFGEALPMACDETAWGRQVNRRVEVWVD